ncbi:MAG: LysM peptidoglycan-binding domain-containing protein [Gammaproteobacteria bacterium]|nr:LysM peptidoglycan-binding domain-containing protein [Gammaproteobacteria bacterium]
MPADDQTKAAGEHPCAQYYEVKKGDTLSDPNKIKPGQKLRIP